MKATEAPEVRELLASQAFVDWYERYGKWHADREELRWSYDEPVMHAILLAGDYEGLSAQAQARFAEIDNDFEMLSEYEAQRQRTTAAWIELSTAETILEEHRQTASEIQRRLEAARKQKGRAPDGVLEKGLEMELRTVKARIDEASDRVTDSSERLRLHTQRRAENWVQVEQAWSAAFRTAMARAEYAYQARRLRKVAETVGKEEAKAANGLGAGAGGERAAAEKAMRERFEALAEEAEEAFGCVLIEEFLYWPRTEDTNRTFCVPLIRDDLHLNVQVAPLKLYEVKRLGGVDFLEPVPDAVDPDEDTKRLHTFFFDGRPTAHE